MICFNYLFTKKKKHEMQEAQNSVRAAPPTATRGLATSAAEAPRRAAQLAAGAPDVARGSCVSIARVERLLR